MHTVKGSKLSLWEFFYKNHLLSYRRHETLSKTAKRLNDDGIRISRRIQGGGHWQRLDFFTVDNLHHILGNRAYKGVRVWRENGKECETKAVWKAIIPPAKFDRIQKMLKGNRSRKKPFSPYSGIPTFCPGWRGVLGVGT